MIVQQLSCMGGFCTKRDSCAHYHTVPIRAFERLCPKGQETYYVPMHASPIPVRHILKRTANA